MSRRNDRGVLVGAWGGLAAGVLLSAVCPGSAQAAGRATIYVNFDGAQLVPSGVDFAPADQSQLALEAPELQNFPAFGAIQAEREATLQAVARDWQDFDVLITPFRPTTGEYTMAMVGPSNPIGEDALGVALLDCGDFITSNVVFAFHFAGDAFTPSERATTISHELGHAFGLEHVASNADVMHPDNPQTDPVFNDDCIDVVGETFCAAQHLEHCLPGAQNGWSELLDRFGAHQPDVTAPGVRIETPGDGERFEPGASVEIRATASDDGYVAGIALVVDGVRGGDDRLPPYVWTERFAAGEVTLVAIATDGAGNEAESDPTTIIIGEGETETETGGGFDGGDDPDSETGCGCGGAMPKQSPWLVVLAVARRRRNR